MNKTMLIAVCLLATVALTAQKPSKKCSTLYKGQSLAIGELRIFLKEDSLVIDNASDAENFVVNLNYDKCYAINPGITVHFCQSGSIPFKDQNSTKVVLRIELPNGDIEKIILFPKTLPPQVMLDGGQLRGYHPASFFFILFLSSISIYSQSNKKTNKSQPCVSQAQLLFVYF